MPAPMTTSEPCKDGSIRGTTVGSIFGAARNTIESACRPFNAGRSSSLTRDGVTCYRSANLTHFGAVGPTHEGRAHQLASNQNELA